MKRFTAQWMLSQDKSILRNMMIELTENHEIVQLVNLNTVAVETANTVFFNGVIAPGIISVSHRNIPEKEVVTSGMGLFRIENSKFVQIITGKSDVFILDFCTENALEINSLIKCNFEFLAGLSLENVIFACTYAPALIMQNENLLKVGKITKLSLWENVDFVNHKLSDATKLTHL